MVLQLATEEKPSVNGVPVLLEIPLPSASPRANLGLLRRNQIGDEVVTFPVISQMNAHKKASLDLMATSYQRRREKTNVWT